LTPVFTGLSVKWTRLEVAQHTNDNVKNSQGTDGRQFKRNGKCIGATHLGNGDVTEVG
jgi:hypothetical protein